MELAACGASHRDGLGVWSAGLGAVAWLASPWLPAPPTHPASGSVEHAFLFLALVATPLALELLARLSAEERGAATCLGVAQRIQPLAAALVLSSFCVGEGRAAGVLAAAWLGMALLVAAAGLMSARRARGIRLARPSLLASQLFLAVGAVWLLLSRLGIGPRALTPLNVLLGALHFHANGFASLVLVGATGSRLGRASSALGRMHGLVTAAAIAGLPLLAAGKLLSSPIVRIVGVGAIALGIAGLAVTTTAVAVRVSSPATRSLLLVSAWSGVAATVLAGAYGVGELAGREAIGVDRMIATHGLLMALGFTLCGLVGHLRLAAGGPVSTTRTRSTAGRAAEGLPLDGVP